MYISLSLTHNLSFEHARFNYSNLRCFWRHLHLGGNRRRNLHPNPGHPPLNKYVFKFFSLVMSCSITRFYYNTHCDNQSGCTNAVSFEDIDTDEANSHEEALQQKEIDYTRIDL
jgi:hypothetical protein